MAKVRLYQRVMVVKRGPCFGQKAQIVALPQGRDREYEVQAYWSFWTFKLKRKDFVVLSRRKTKC